MNASARPLASAVANGHHCCVKNMKLRPARVVPPDPETVARKIQEHIGSPVSCPGHRPPSLPHSTPCNCCHTELFVQIQTP